LSKEKTIVNRKNGSLNALLICILATAFCLSNPHFSLAYEKEINNLSTTMAENITRAGKKTIAVVDFTDLQGNVTELGRFLAEEFSVAFAGAGKGFEVVDRTHLRAILQEHKLSMTGLIDPKTARKLGQIAGVEALLTGTITAFGDSVRVSIKILDPATAKVIGAARGSIAKTQGIEELLAKGIESGQSFSQQSSTPNYAPSSRNKKSKKVGDITITVKKILASKGRIYGKVLVALDFFNQSNRKLIIARTGDYKPNLADEKGNIFKYEDGLARPTYNDGRGTDKYGLTLNPKLHNDVVFEFRYRTKEIAYKDIGSIFTLSVGFWVYDSKDKSLSKHQVSFMDIKTQGR
jgi:TolB-like protein